MTWKIGLAALIVVLASAGAASAQQFGSTPAARARLVPCQTDDKRARIDACARLFNDRDREVKAAAHYYRGQAYRELGEPKPAIADLDQAISLNPDLLLAFYERGLAKLDIWDFDGAIADETDCLTRKYDSHGLWYVDADGQTQDRPVVPEALMARATAYSGKEDFPHALADVEAVIALKPGRAEGYMARGVVYGGLGQYDRAIADEDHALQIDPDYANAYWFRGLAKRFKGDATSDADIAQAIALDPSYKDKPLPPRKPGG